MKRWLFDYKRYHEHLLACLPMANFIPWCFELLAKEEPVDRPSQYQLFKVANLMFCPEVKFSLGSREEPGRLTLADGELSFPKIDLSRADVPS